MTSSYIYTHQHNIVALLPMVEPILHHATTKTHASERLVASTRNSFVAGEAHALVHVCVWCMYSRPPAAATCDVHALFINWFSSSA